MQISWRIQRNAPPEFRGGKAVMVPGQDEPGQIAFLSHRLKGLP
jgi:hypothetical protein